MNGFYTLLDQEVAGGWIFHGHTRRSGLISVDWIPTSVSCDLNRFPDDITTLDLHAKHRDKHAGRKEVLGYIKRFLDRWNFDLWLHNSVNGNAASSRFVFGYTSGAQRQGTAVVWRHQGRITQYLPELLRSLPPDGQVTTTVGARTRAVCANSLDWVMEEIASGGRARWMCEETRISADTTGLYVQSPIIETIDGGVSCAVIPTAANYLLRRALDDA